MALSDARVFQTRTSLPSRPGSPGRGKMARPRDRCGAGRQNPVHRSSLRPMPNHVLQPSCAPRQCDGGHVLITTAAKAEVNAMQRLGLFVSLCLTVGCNQDSSTPHLPAAGWQFRRPSSRLHRLADQRGGRSIERLPSRPARDTQVPPRRPSGGLRQRGA